MREHAEVPGRKLNTEIKMNTVRPTRMENTAPVALAFFQYIPRMIGHRKTASSPPKAKRLIQTNRSGGLKEAAKTRIPAARVHPKLIRLSFFGEIREASFFRL